MSSSADTACTDAEEDAEDVENDVAGTAQSSRYLSSVHRRRENDHLEGLRLDGSSVVPPPLSSEDTSGSTEGRPSTPWARGKQPAESPIGETVGSRTRGGRLEARLLEEEGTGVPATANTPTGGVEWSSESINELIPSDVAAGLLADSSRGDPSPLLLVGRTGELRRFLIPRCRDDVRKEDVVQMTKEVADPATIRQHCSRRIELLATEARTAGRPGLQWGPKAAINHGTELHDEGNLSRDRRLVSLFVTSPTGSPGLSGDRRQRSERRGNPGCDETPSGVLPKVP
ncbi:hypothetical protein EAI_09707 [Harpegnathos saltator]|uniref:Uncharacterized protein n=1 Tax=Harpegnathos saltator TaxID=610380 RepID=E2C8H6_HARSA|nr:hypothetical protein EAI_09707 [Harpegnathos saltator]